MLSRGARLSFDFDDLKRARFSLSAQIFFIELADARLGNLRDESPAFGNPPLGDARFEEGAKLIRLWLNSVFQDDAGERAFVPAFIRHADDCGFDDVRMSHNLILKLDG